MTLGTARNLNNRYKDLLKKISKLETRKVIFKASDLVTCPECVNHALKFEELYIISK